jgi:hypothetical protein
VNEVDEAVALALRELSDALCGFGARLDQLEAARRDLLTPNAPTHIEGISDDF